MAERCWRVLTYHDGAWRVYNAALGPLLYANARVYGKIATEHGRPNIRVHDSKLEATLTALNRVIGAA